MDNIEKNKNSTLETDLSGHKHSKKVLVPPLNTLALSSSSWLNHRMPEMMWAVVVIGNLPRETYLDFFRQVGNYVSEHNEFWDITISAISSLPAEQKKKFLTFLVEYSPEVKNLLKSLAVFPEFPLITELMEVYGIEDLDDLEHEELNVMISSLANGVNAVMGQQSEATTDCRWVKSLCRVQGKKVSFSSSIEGIDDIVKGLYEYPNYGDLSHVKSFIRSSEIIPSSHEKPDDFTWANHFWDICYKHTECRPKNNSSLIEEKMKTCDTQNEHYLKETARTRTSLIDSFFSTSNTSAIDAKHEGAFGLALFANSLLIDVALYKMTYSITARLALRSVVETYITFAYLIALNDEEEWETFRTYGGGQAKLVYLKLKDLQNKPKSILVDDMRKIANEDVWQEFLNINLGHWGTTNLREMSEKAELKDIYDIYYNYTSGFVHGNWSAVRESVYEQCFNPLHRLHRIPTFDFPMLAPTVEDITVLVNKIFELLHSLYPDFEEEIQLYSKK